MDINLTDYQKRKDSGNLAVAKVGNEFYSIAFAQYDPATGERLPDSVGNFSMKELDKGIAEITARLTDLQAFKADLQAIK